MEAVEPGRDAFARPAGDVQIGAVPLVSPPDRWTDVPPPQQSPVPAVVAAIGEPSIQPSPNYWWNLGLLPSSGVDARSRQDATHGTVSAQQPSDMPVRVEELAGNVSVHWCGVRPVALLLPGDGAPTLDPASVQGLARTVPGVLLLYGRLDDDAFVLPHGRRASIDAVAATVRMLPSAPAPVLLMMPGGDAIAHRLATVLGVPVTGACNGVEVLPEQGLLRAAGGGGPLLRFDPDAEGTAGHPLALRRGAPWRPGVGLADTDTGAGTDTAPTTTSKGEGTAEPAGPSLSSEPMVPPKPPTAHGTDTDTGSCGGGNTDVDGASDHRLREHRANQPQSDVHAPAPYREPPLDPASFEVRAADPRIRSIGVPKAGLPHLAEVVAQLRGWATELGYEVHDEVWNRLPQQLLANYPFLLSGEQRNRPEGLIVPLGPVEALVTLDPRQPSRVANPAGSVDGPDQVPASAGAGAFRATATVNSTYATGAHVQSESSGTSATPFGVSLNFGVSLPSPVAHLLSVGAGVSGVANRSGRTTTHIADSERGHVEDNRADATLVSYRPNWTVRLRPVRTQRADWRDVEDRPVNGPESQRLLLWLPSPYLEAAEEDQVVATGKDVLRDQLPGTYFASGITGLPAMYDGVARAMEEGGVPLSGDARTHDELVDKLWNLPSFLDHAVNGVSPDGGRSRGGYTFRLHDKYGRTVATVTVHAARLAPGQEQQVGATSNKSHLENVRTAIDGTGGEHRLGQSSTLTPVNAVLDLTPRPDESSDAGLGVSTSLSVTWTNGDALGATRTGLWVMVPRFAGDTVAYRARFMLWADVALRREGADTVRRTGMVESQALLRLPRPEAFRHGFPVERSALRNPTTGRDVPYHSAALRGGPTPEQQQEPDLLPRHLRNDTPYRGIGMGLVEVPEETADALFEAITEALHGHDFLLPGDQENPIGGHSWWRLSSGLESRVDNDDLLYKFLYDGLAVHHDRIHQDGLTFVLHRRRGFAGMEFDVDAARITINATRSRPTEFLDRGNDHHLVNLAMGMDSASVGVSGGKVASLSLRARGMFRYLLGGATGIGLSAGMAASEGAFFLNNRPELLESSSAEFLRLKVTSDFIVTIELQHSGAPGKIGKGRRNPEPLWVPNQSAIVRVLPLGDGAQGVAAGRGPTPPRVLDQAVIFHLDSKGMRGALNQLLPSLDGPQGRAARALDSMAATLRAHLKEAAFGSYTTDQPFDSGLLRDTFAALDVKAKLGPSVFLGASTDPFVQGVIKLWLSQATTTTSRSRGLNWIQADVTVGGVSKVRPTSTGVGSGQPGSITTSDGVTASRSWQHNDSESFQQTAAKELIQLSFSNIYLYSSKVDLTLTKLAEKHGKLMRSARDYGRETLSNHEMLYLLPEPEALALYASGDLPVSDQQLTSAMERWAHGRLNLPANTVGRLLARWHPDSSPEESSLQYLSADESADSPNQIRRSAESVAARLEWARLLHEQHTASRAIVWDADARATFREAFGDDFALDERANPLAALTLPEYLTRRDHGGNILGHSNVVSIDHEGNRSTADLFQEAVERVAPGLLTKGADLWSAHGRHIGRLQGSLDTVLNLFSRGRDDAVYEDFLSKNGVEFYLANQVGWFLTDMVKVTVQAELCSGVQVREHRPNAGLENYGHHQSNSVVSSSRDATQSFTVGKVSSGPEHGSGGASAAFGNGQHRGVTHTKSGVSEQTVYSWNGLYEATVRHRFTVTASRVDMPNRPLNELSLAALRGLRLLAPRAVHQVIADGVTRLHLPPGIANFTPTQRSGTPDRLRDLRRLGRLPGDAYVAGVVLNQSQKTAEDLLRAVFGVGGVDQKRVSSLLNLLMSRTHLTNVLGRVGPGERLQLSSHLFQPGASAHGVKLFLRSAMYDLQVLGDVTGTGTGRYVKSQSGTSVFASTDHWQPALSANGSGSGSFGHHDAHNGSASTSQPRLTSPAQSVSGSENYRREQHVKQQSPVKLVRIRLQVHLEAEVHLTRIFNSPEWRGRRVSEPINGEMYIEMSEGGLRVLQEQLKQSRAAIDRRNTAWRAAARATPVDLAPLLVQASQEDGADVSRVDLVICRLLAEQIGPLDSPRALALTMNPDQLALESHRATLEWAVQTLQDDHKAILAERPAATPPPQLAVYQHILDRAPHNAPPGTADMMRERTAVVVDAMRAYQVTRPGNLDGRRCEPPTALACTDADYEALVRDLAHHMNAHVRFVSGEGQEYDRWIDPSGIIHSSDPRRSGRPRMDDSPAPVENTSTDTPVTAQTLNRPRQWLEAITRRGTPGSLARAITQRISSARANLAGAARPAARVPAGQVSAPRNSVSRQYVARFEEGAYALGPEETWWLEQAADHFAATVAQKVAAGELDGVQVTFTGRGNGSVLSRGRARATAFARAETARRIWNERLSQFQKPDTSQNFLYSSDTVPGERFEGDGAQANNRTVRVEVEFIRPTIVPCGAEGTQHPPGRGTSHVAAEPHPKSKPGTAPPDPSTAEQSSAIRMSRESLPCEKTPASDPEGTYRMKPSCAVIAGTAAMRIPGYAERRHTDEAVEISAAPGIKYPHSRTVTHENSTHRPAYY